MRAAGTPFAYAKAAPVPLRPRGFRPRPAGRAHSSSERYTDNETATSDQAGVNQSSAPKRLDSVARKEEGVGERPAAAGRIPGPPRFAPKRPIPASAVIKSRLRRPKGIAPRLLGFNTSQSQLRSKKGAARLPPKDKQRWSQARREKGKRITFPRLAEARWARKKEELKRRSGSTRKRKSVCLLFKRTIEERRASGG